MFQEGATQFSVACLLFSFFLFLQSVPFLLLEGLA